MKNFVFAFQVFGLMAILPVLATLELNHGTQFTATKTIKEPAVKNKEALPGDLTYALAGFPIAALVFGKMNFLSDQKCNDENCTCQNCKCGSNCTCKDL